MKELIFYEKVWDERFFEDEALDLSINSVIWWKLVSFFLSDFSGVPNLECLYIFTGF